MKKETRVRERLSAENEQLRKIVDLQQRALYAALKLNEANRLADEAGDELEALLAEAEPMLLR